MVLMQVTLCCCKSPDCTVSKLQYYPWNHDGHFKLNVYNGLNYVITEKLAVNTYSRLQQEMVQKNRCISSSHQKNRSLIGSIKGPSGILPLTKDTLIFCSFFVSYITEKKLWQPWTWSYCVHHHDTTLTLHFLPNTISEVKLTVDVICLPY